MKKNTTDFLQFYSSFICSSRERFSVPKFAQYLLLFVSKFYLLKFITVPFVHIARLLWDTMERLCSYEHSFSPSTLKLRNGLPLRIHRSLYHRSNPCQHPAEHWRLEI